MHFDLISDIVLGEMFKANETMLYFIEFEGIAFLILSLYIIFVSNRPEKGLWRITSSRLERLQKKQI